MRCSSCFVERVKSATLQHCDSLMLYCLLYVVRWRSLGLMLLEEFLEALHLEAVVDIWVGVQGRLHDG